MPIVQRLQSLKRQHAKVDARLAVELARPWSDQNLVASLKHRKLSLKDLIASMQRMISNQDALDQQRRRIA
ncbi:MAG: DUF465 domain-containing protein [Alphaproteobacteria bacterium]|nr:MAG: DUF465 domain-containing protein [Alphaproteobacteria bacterium]